VSNWPTWSCNSCAREARSVSLHAEQARGERLRAFRLGGGAGLGCATDGDLGLELAGAGGDLGGERAIEGGKIVAELFG
jgi:hypothetical protein